VKTDPVTEQGFHGPTAYYAAYTKWYLQQHYSPAEVFGGGLQVDTGLDMGMQRDAERAIAAHMPGGPHQPEAALVAIDPRDGQIRAMVGGRSYARSQVNLATGQGSPGRSAGSAFKPFVLATALKQGYSLNSYWSGPSQITIEDPRCDTNGQPWQPSNAADEESGTFSLATATKYSVNTVYAQLVSQVGPNNVVKMAHNLGITSPLNPVCSIALGSQPVTPLEMTNAYGTFADRGVRHDATPLANVDDSRGHSITVPEKSTRELRANDAALVTYALQGVVEGGTGTAANLYDRPVAGKTGTAQDYSDAWFCGYTPQLVTCVWMGYPQSNKPLVNIDGYGEVFGGTIPATIWHDFMSKALAGARVMDFPTPDFSGYTKGPSVPVAIPTTPAPPATHTPKSTPTPGHTHTPTPEPTTPSPTPTASGGGGGPGGH